MRLFNKNIGVDYDEITEMVKNHMNELKDKKSLDPLVEKAGNKKIVMLGEASHGTHEYYTWRAAITERLIKEKGFNFIAVEGDWPPCYNINRFIKGYREEGDNARQVLSKFDRWPSWMWANWEVNALTEMLHDHNKSKAINHKVGFYGLDVYSLWESLEAIVGYLEKEDPLALETAREALACFEPYNQGEGQAYARSISLVPEGCRKEVVDMLTEIRSKKAAYDSDREAVFSTEQNALVAKNAEEYYRIMVEGGRNTWNLRDQHMMDTLNRLLDFQGPEAKAVIWAHNTHVGDASHTDMAERGMFNLGQLAREQYGAEKIYLVGFGSYKGSVIAGEYWDAPMQKMDLPPAKYNSWEELLHRIDPKDKMLFMENFRGSKVFSTPVGHRAVGVVYDPSFERYGNYVPSVIANRYDAFIHIDRTRTLYPLHSEHPHGETPETYPFGV